MALEYVEDFEVDREYYRVESERGLIVTFEMYFTPLEKVLPTSGQTVHLVEGVDRRGDMLTSAEFIAELYGIVARGKTSDIPKRIFETLEEAREHGPALSTWWRKNRKALTKREEDIQQEITLLHAINEEKEVRPDLIIRDMSCCVEVSPSKVDKRALEYFGCILIESQLTESTFVLKHTPSGMAIFPFRSKVDDGATIVDYLAITTEKYRGQPRYQVIHTDLPPCGVSRHNYVVDIYLDLQEKTYVTGESYLSTE